MKVLYVASEALPFMASGGLGDVAGSLPVALRKRLIGCRVVMRNNSRNVLLRKSRLKNNGKRN